MHDTHTGRKKEREREIMHVSYAQEGEERKEGRKEGRQQEKKEEEKKDGTRRTASKP